MISQEQLAEWKKEYEEGYPKAYKCIPDLIAEVEKLQAQFDWWHKACTEAWEYRDRALAENEKLRAVAEAAEERILEGHSCVCMRPLGKPCDCGQADLREALKSWREVSK